jgi:hypothetical protein
MNEARDAARSPEHARPSSRQRQEVTVPSACRTCGIVLKTADRIYCPDCIAVFKQERTDKLVSAARSVLAEMRSGGPVPG